MQTLSSVLRSIFEDHLDKYICVVGDNKMIQELEKDLIAEVSLATSGMAYVYNAVDVAIVHKKLGLFSENRFTFSNYGISSYVELESGEWAWSQRHVKPKDKELDALIQDVTGYFGVWMS